MLRLIITTLLCAAAGMAAAQTSCAPRQLPWEETFDSHAAGTTAMPPCWYATHNYDLGAAPHIDTTQHHSGTQSLTLFSGSRTGSHYSMVIGPATATALGTGVFLRVAFMAHATTTAIEVGICDDTLRQTRNFTPLDTLRPTAAGRWQESLVDLSAYHGNGRRIAFRLQRTLQGDTASCHIDDLRMETCLTTGLRVYNIGHDRLTADWQQHGAGSITVAWNGLTATGTEPPLTLTGLTPATTYTIGVGCSGDERQEVQVTTLPEPTLRGGYHETFDGTQLPPRWMAATGCTPTVAQGRLTMHPTADESCVAVLPELAAGESTAALTASLRYRGDAGTTIEVGLMDYGGEAGSFVAAGPAADGDGQWHQATTPLDSYGGNGRFIALRATGNGTVTIDDVRVARCMVDNVRLYNLGESSVSLVWDTLTMADGATTTIEYGPTSFAPGSGTTMSATTNPLTIAGLDMATAYDLIVHAGCGDTVGAADRHHFETFAHEVTVPYCMDFEGTTTLPQGWSCGTGTATIGNSAYSGQHAMALGANTVVTLPRVTGGDSVVLECHTYGSGKMEIGTMASPYGTFTPTDTLTGGSGWHRQLLTMSLPTGRMVALRTTTPWNIDNLMLHHDAVHNAAATVIGRQTATVAWQTLRGDSAEVEYRRVASATADFTAGTGTTMTAHDTAHLDGLEPNSHYALHLRPLGDDGACHHETLHLLTAAEETATPYCENFDQTTGYPSGWRRLSQAGTYPIVSTERNHSPGKALLFSATASKRTVALLPDFATTTAHLTLGFWTNVTQNSQGALLMVGHMSNIADMATFEPSDTLDLGQSDTWKHHLIDLGDNINGVALMLVGGGSSATRLFVDDLCVESCAASDIRLVAVGSTTFTMAWTSHGTSAIEVAMTLDGQPRRDTLATSPGTIAGLTPGQTYSIDVRSLCECGGYGAAHRSGYGTTGSATSDQRTGIAINSHIPIVATPYCQGFEEVVTGRFPYMWQHIGCNPTVSDRNYHEGSHSLMVSGNGYVVLPPMEEVGEMVVTLQAYASSEGGMAEGALTVGVMESPNLPETFVAVDTLRPSHIGEWQGLWADLSAYSGNGSFIALKIDATDGCTFFLDDISVARCGIAQANAANDGSVDWQPLHSPTAVAIEYGPQGFVRGSGQHDTATAPPHTLHGIAAGERYDIYLTPLCGTNASCLPTRTTIGGTIATPYCENFESVPPYGMPTGWTTGRTHDDTPAIAGGSNQSLTMKGHADNTHRSLVALPELQPGGRMQLTLSLKSSASNARLVVGHIAANGDPNTFTATDTLATTATQQWQRLTTSADLPPQRRWAMACLSLNQSNVQVWIDSLSVTRGITPTLIATSARSIAVSGTGSYIEYGPAGIEQGEGTTMFTGDDGDTITGLTPGAEYWFYTRENATDPTCLPPLATRMPVEATLPYCVGSSTVSLMQLPEMDIETLADLHLALTLDGPCQLQVGVMERDGDWDHLVPTDTVTVAAGVRRQVHLTLAAYHGSGRFVGLRSLGGTTALHSLAATSCAPVEATLNHDNTVALNGHGTVEYGPHGFEPGHGTTLTVDGTTTLTLDDTTLYDYYTACGTAAMGCQPPMQWQTTCSVPLPYCVEPDGALPAGWTPFGNATGESQVTASGNTVTLGVATHQTVGVMLPAMAEHDVVVDLEVLLSNEGVSLMAGDDTLHTTPGQWQAHRLRMTHDGRIAFTATGNGTASLRNIEVNTCALPRDVAIVQPGDGLTEMAWDDSGTPQPIYVEYTLAGSSETLSMQATASPLALQLLPDTTYSLRLTCEQAGTTCLPTMTVHTLGTPQPLPYCTHFETTAGGTMPEEWHTTNTAGGTYLVMPQFDVATTSTLNVVMHAQTQYATQRILLGIMSDAGNPSTFDTLTIFNPTENNGRLMCTLSGYHGNGRFIALRCTGEGWVRVSHLAVDTSMAHHLAMTESSAGHVVIEWQEEGSPQVSVEYGPLGFEAGEGTMISPATTPLTIDGLATLTDYAFLVRRSGSDGSCAPAEVDTFLVFTPKGGSGCIDYTDLHAPYVSCRYGSYDNPHEHTGTVDHGYLSAISRHTVHFDTTERDARTGGLLRTVPPNEKASVRLGNWTSSGFDTPQAESITYALNVDTNDFDILVLRYATVLQDPEHSPDLQPRFRLQILDLNEQLVNTCSSADFIANPSLTEGNGSQARNVWHEAPNDVLWKDWTTVGLDLTPYAGQTILIRLTTNDCGEGSHFGYAYFTLDCSTRQMLTEGCSNVPDNRFTAPSGFDYSWYTNHSPDIISDSASIWVPSDNNTIYYCRLAFVDNPECNFTMSAFAGARYPLAIIDTLLTVENCQYDLTVTDRSTISNDRLTPIGTGESCESRRWLLPDGSEQTTSSISLHFDDTGHYDITLVVGIANDQCLDTLRRTLLIRRPHPNALLEAPGRRCDNMPPDTLRVLHATSYHWTSGVTGPLSVAPSADTVVACVATDTNGCTTTLTHAIHVLPSYDRPLTDSICLTQPTYLWLDTLVDVDVSQPIMQRIRRLHTTEGCDSTFRLALALMPSFDIHHHDTVCHDVAVPFFDTTLATTGTYLHTDRTAFGCDSLVSLHLEVLPRRFVTDRQEACDSLTWIDRRTYYSDTSGIVDTIATTRGCDSVVTLVLAIHQSTFALEQDTFCQGTTYTFRNIDATKAGRYADTLATTHGCDSILAIDLVRLDTPRVDIEHHYDCDTLYHHIEVHSSVPYLLWSSSPYDSTLDLSPHDSLLSLKPSVPTVYTLYADYAEVPHCPVTTTLTLLPQTRPHAQLRVNPDALVWPKTNFDAYDVGIDYGERAWYINGELQAERSRHLSSNMPDGNNTALVALHVSDGHCADTATALIPLLRSALAAPNIFTPSQDNNNTFHIEGLGILQAEVHIYNRYGVLVFSSDDLALPWDGHDLEGRPCPTGNYVWHVRYSAETRPGAFNESTGTVLLVR